MIFFLTRHRLNEIRSKWLIYSVDTASTQVITNERFYTTFLMGASEPLATMTSTQRPTSASDVSVVLAAKKVHDCGKWGTSHTGWLRVLTTALTSTDKVINVATAKRRRGPVLSGADLSCHNSLDLNIIMTAFDETHTLITAVWNSNRSLASW